MKSWTLGRISGILIRVHWTFLLLPIYIYFSSLMAGSGLAAAVESVIFVLAIFGCVLLHELGHALAARQFGIPTRDITLLPIGGVAALERMPRNPAQELWIAVAGPLVNIVIATSLFAGIWLGMFNGLPGYGLIQNLAIANIVLVVFNMIPAFPMDGGRVLRSTLAMFMDWVKATSIAVSVGKFAAIAFGLLGLLSGNFILVLVAAFVYFAAQSELMAISASYQQDGFSPSWRGAGTASSNGSFAAEVGRQPETQGDLGLSNSVPSTLSTSSVAAWLASRKEEYCQVVESGRTIGTVSKSQLLVALSRGYGNMPIESLVR